MKSLKTGVPGVPLVAQQLATLTKRLKVKQRKNRSPQPSLNQLHETIEVTAKP